MFELNNKRFLCKVANEENPFLWLGLDALTIADWGSFYTPKGCW